MALVLCTGSNRALMQTRRMILESAGHSVVEASSFAEVQDTCAKHDFDVVVIGQSVIPNEKKRIRTLVREVCSSAKVLELYSTWAERVIDDADVALQVPAETPTNLADAVEELASRKKTRRQTTDRDH